MTRKTYESQPSITNVESQLRMHMSCQSSFSHRHVCHQVCTYRGPWYLYRERHFCRSLTVPVQYRDQHGCRYISTKRDLETYI